MTSRAAYVAPRNAAERLVADAVSGVLNVADPSVHDDFFQLGGHSLLAVQLAARLEADTGKAVPVRTIFEASTVEGLARNIRESDAVEYRPLLSFDHGREQNEVKADTGRLRLYCIHGASGHAMTFQQFVAPLRDQTEVIGVQSRGLSAGEDGHRSYAEMIDTYATAICDDAADEMVVLFGWSLGGYVAHDLACRLRDQGRFVGGVVILDSVEPGLIDPLSHPPSGEFRDWLVASLSPFLPDNSKGILATSEVETLVRMAGEAVPWQEYRMEEIYRFPQLFEHLLQVWHHNSQLLKQREKSRYFPGPALVIRATDTRAVYTDETLGWSTYYAALESRDLPFKHLELMKPASVTMMAQLLRDWLTRIARKTTS